MTGRLSVCCPACRREHLYTAPAFPCVCGATVTPELDRHGTATAVTHAVSAEDWMSLRCAVCGRRDEWPYPELGCACGTVLRVPVTGRSAAPPAAAGAGDPEEAGPRQRRPRLPPVEIRTARDAVTAAALYLRRLGYRDLRRADQRPPSGVGLAARGLLAQVDPTVRPASLRDVECLWLTAMTESAGCVYFSLAGYAGDARARADDLGVPLFVLDLTGTAQPVNSVADELDGGAPPGGA
ncbi:hypothetical protein [Streptomyces panaciradicis]|uniref:hypothetical protein n=1 Tax=Streptomyces panaciradicis TaxID=1470261 RepID=UPI00201CC34B|nr:hypothetical protein [Streptomyces panaciradicis]MCL6673370.1 hypothetical protein [Streptomyces panaciradicis]